MPKEKIVVDSNLYIDQTTKNANEIVNLVATKEENQETIQQSEKVLDQLQSQINELRAKMEEQKDIIKTSKIKIKKINWQIFKNKRFSKKLSRAYTKGTEVNSKKYTK